jgi:hypothetical protein
MKFTALVVASVAVISTASALDRCDYDVLLPIVNGKDATTCTKESGFSLVVAVVSESPAKPDQYAAICRSPMCMGVISEKLYVPVDCELKDGKSL